MNFLNHALLLGQDGGGSNLGGLIYMGVMLVVMIGVIAGVWKTFAKAGKPGWGCLIPIYNIILLLEIAEKPLWWIILYLIPLVNIVVAILISIEIATKFGKGAGFGLGLAFLGFIFFPILGFGDAKYKAA